MSLGGALGWLAGSVLRIRRRHVSTAMARAGVGDYAAQMYRQLGGSLVAFLRGGSVEIDAETLVRAADAGPVVLFASHTGNWELCAAAAARALATDGHGFRIVAKPMHSAFFDRWLARVRARLGVRTIAPAGAMLAAARALASGDVVAMPIDQVPDRPEHALQADFLGSTAHVDRAPATIAWRARATVLVIADGRVIDVIPAPGPQDRARAWIDQTTRRGTAALEAFVRANPAAWMWLHRRWRAPLVASRAAE